MIILAKDEKTGARIFKYDKDDNNPTFTISIDNYGYSHSVRNIEKPDSYEWYCDVMGRQFLELYERSYEQGRKEVQNEIKGALGLPRRQ